MFNAHLQFIQYKDKGIHSKLRTQNSPGTTTAAAQMMLMMSMIMDELLRILLNHITLSLVGIWYGKGNGV